MTLAALLSSFDRSCANSTLPPSLIRRLARLTASCAKTHYQTLITGHTVKLMMIVAAIAVAAIAMAANAVAAIAVASTNR